jgi:phosphatidylserine/phosphatidylglycerophosphate/cardiolipin synthase-like enzyme
MLDNAREAIFILVRFPSRPQCHLSFDVYDPTPRIGGFRRNCILDVHANSMRTTASTESLSAGLRLVSKCTSLCTRKWVVIQLHFYPAQRLLGSQVTQTMNMSSSWTKHALEPLHPNIVVMRHPDHIGSQGAVRRDPSRRLSAQPIPPTDSIQFWSHHEKVVVVDNHFAAIGGLDLCFGRWDTHTHPLADVHPTGFERTLFPGQDYNNARVMDFKDVKDYVGSTVSILETPRMPWHDVSPVPIVLCFHVLMGGY